MFDHHLWNLYILNPLTLERIDLPRPRSIFSERFKPNLRYNPSCLWIDDITKDYLVFWGTDYYVFFTKKGNDTWRIVNHELYGQIVYNHKDEKVYTYASFGQVYVWDFSGDIPLLDGYPPHHDIYNAFNAKHSSSEDTLCWYLTSNFDECIATTVSGQVLQVCYSLQDPKYQFYIYKSDPLRQKKWVQVDSLGDEALILGMGFTVIANDIPGIKRNSIYVSGYDYARDDPNHIFVYDLTTRTVEPLPQCIFSSIRFSDARWFFPDLTL
ncbi:unnamed protein product [Arabis nemorensis]|uniref:KIB1-4 beta-propeller domain-containing protein n=1 Tax=Arabis nemorensis TaxID=586526 RepID=A0A565CHN3_9BRAS|nr:unnamed protein product [Arabis nemorensis]